MGENVNFIKKGKNIAVRPENIIEARYDLTAKQNDILDIVFSKVEDDNIFIYEIDLNEYKKIYKKGQTNIYRDLKKCVKTLEGKGFNIIDNSINEEVFFPWFSKIRYKNDDGIINLKIDDELKGYILKAKKKIFYDINYTLNFKSMYTKRIYYYLMSFKDTGWRIDNLDKLRDKMNCPESYKPYGTFKKRVLEVAKEEINGNTDINFDYEEIKTKRKVTGLKFTIKKNFKSKKQIDPDIKIVEQLPGQIDIDEQKLIFKVKEIIKGPISDTDISNILEVAANDLDIIKKYYDYAKTQNVDKLTPYLMSAIKGKYDLGEVKVQKKSKFANFKERDDWDFDKIEKLARKNIEKELNEN